MSRRALGTALLGLTSAALLLWVAPPGEVVKQIGDMSPAWLLAVVAFELGLVTRRAGAGAPRPVRAIAAGLEGAWRSLGAPHWRLLGMAGFLCLDMAALWAACAATGHSIGFLALAIAYCIGYLTTLVPM